MLLLEHMYIKPALVIVKNVGRNFLNESVQMHLSIPVSYLKEILLSLELKRYV